MLKTNCCWNTWQFRHDKRMLVHGFPRPACQDLSARMHACHFELLPDLIMVPIFWNNQTDPFISMLKTKCCWNIKTILMQREVLYTSNCLSILVPIVEFGRFPLIWTSAFWAKADTALESLAFHRVFALLRTDRDHEQKLVLTRLFALLPGRGKSLNGFWTFSKYPLYLSSILLAPHCALKLPNTINIRSSVSLAPYFHKRIKRSFIIGLSLHIFFLPNSTLLCCHNLLVMLFPQVVVPPNWARKDFAHEVHLMGSCLQIALFSAEFKFRTRCIRRISGVSHRSVQSQFFNFP